MKKTENPALVMENIASEKIDFLFNILLNGDNGLNKNIWGKTDV